MNNIDFSRARNGTRIALNKNHLILLVALAVLSLAIVFLCVSYNLNALATDNIAFAEDPEKSRVEESEEPSRYVGSTGYVSDNMLPLNYAYNWDFNVNNLTYGTPYTLYSGNGWDIIINCTGSIIGNHLHVTGGTYVSLKFFITDSSLLESVPSYHTFAISYLCTNLNNNAHPSSFTGYFRSGGSNYSTNSVTSNSNNYAYFSQNNRRFSSIGDGVFIDFLVNPGELGYDFDFYWVYCAANTSSFAGYVSPDYKYYGYNQGYQDGLDNAPTPDFTNSTGLVGSNILKYNYWLDADFDISSQGTTTIWEQTEDNQKIDLVHAILQNNVLTPFVESREREDTRSVRTSSMLKYIVPHRNGAAEVFAVYVSALTGSWELGLMNSERSVVLSVGLNVLYIPATESVRVPTETYNIFTLDTSASITISWCKLESGTAFTGYVAPDNANSYQAGYEQGLIDGYYNGITDLNSIKTVLRNVPLETRTPYYAVNVTESPYGVNNDFMDITYHIASAVSGVTYGNYIPVIFNLAYNVPVGLDLFWKFEGAILNPHSSEIDPNGSLTIYYGFYDNISFVGYGPEFAPYQETISWPSSSSSNYEVVFHARYSGNYLVLWFYTDNDNPYYEFGIRTPMVDGSYNSNPFYFEYNPYTITDSSVNLDNARQQGYQEGFNSGYNQGKFENSVSGQYTFKNLIGSVFDAPITALLGTYDEREGARVGGLLNFEVLGVNLGGFVIGLLSLAIILFVLRVFMRGL